MVRYRTEWKAPGLKLQAEPIDLAVEFFPGMAEEVAQAARALGATQVQTGRSTLSLRLPGTQVAGLLQSEAVVLAQETRPAQLFNNEAAAIIQASGSGSPWDSGLHGAGQVVGVADTGLDTGSLATLHPDFQSNLVAAFARGRPGDWSDPAGATRRTAG